MIKTVYQGNIDIEAWEFVLIPVYLLVIFIITSRIKNVRIAKQPEYKYYLLGLYAKIFGGLAFGMVYIFHYGGGDTISYYESGRAMVNVFYRSPLDFLTLEFGEASPERFAIFDYSTGWLVGWLYDDPRSYMVIRLISPLMILAFRSYFLTTILVAWVTYEGLWRLYLMFVRYYPQLMWPMAVAVLFMPSTVFWGSGIMKDPFTMAATGLYVSLVDEVLVRRNFKFRAVAVGLLSAWLLLSLKPYIFLVLFPGTMYWVFNERIRKLRNALVKFVLLPMALGLLTWGSFTVMTLLGDTLGKFSLEEALQTATVTSTYLRSDAVGGNNFNIGEFEATWSGALGKFVPATLAGLFRPYLWDVANVVMLLSALENTFLLVMFIRLLWRTKIIAFLPVVFKDPLVAFCLLFSVAFGFMIGLTTSNFGSMVRFKIPMLPFLVAGLYVALRLYSVPRRYVPRPRPGPGPGAPVTMPGPAPSVAG